MAGLSDPSDSLPVVSSCCTPEKQAECCASSEKAKCCPPDAGKCGCQVSPKA